MNIKAGGIGLIIIVVLFSIEPVMSQPFGGHNKHNASEESEDDFKAGHLMEPEDEMFRVMRYEQFSDE
jgi:hypothetical protein